MKSFRKPKASTIGTPIYHRKRRTWRDDKDLLEELLEILKKIDSPYDYFDSKVKNLREKIESFAANGFEENIEVFLMAMWIREKLTELTIKQGSYNLQVHAIEIPESIDQVLRTEETKATRSNAKTPLNVSLSELFPNHRLRAFALERIQMLHRGDLAAYLSSLVAKEKSSLMSCSASIMDMISICEHKLDLRKLKVSKKFSVGESDLWIPDISLGVEVRDSWDENKEIEIIRTLSDTNFRKRALHLCLVTPDDLSDTEFIKLRDIEKRNVIENLSVIRIGDFGPYLDEIMKTVRKITG